MYKAGIFLLTIAAVLMTLFGRAFLSGETRGWIVLRFDELYYWGQWIGFWCALLSVPLLWYGMGQPRLTWRMLPLAAAALLCIRFVVWNMPEASNSGEWRSGSLGLRLYLRTKRRHLDEEREARRTRARFAGVWRSGDGGRVSIEEDVITVELDGLGTRLSAATCESPNPRQYTWEPPERVDYLFARTNLRFSPLRRELQRRSYPQLQYSCGNREYVFVLLDDRSLYALLPSGAAFLLRRQAR